MGERGGRGRGDLRAPRATARAWTSISSRVMGSVVSWPWTTIAAESPTSSRSTPASSTCGRHRRPPPPGRLARLASPSALDVTQAWPASKHQDRPRQPHIRTYWRPRLRCQRGEADASSRLEMCAANSQCQPSSTRSVCVHLALLSRLNPNSSEVPGPSKFHWNSSNCMCRPEALRSC